MRQPSHRGLCLSEIRVNDDGVVQFQSFDEWVDITTIGTITDVFGETHTDPNGIELDIRETLNHFVLAKPQYENIRSAESFPTTHTDSVFDARTKTFLMYFENYLDGVVDPSRRFNEE